MIQVWAPLLLRNAGRPDVARACEVWNGGKPVSVNHVAAMVKPAQSENLRNICAATGFVGSHGRLKPNL